MKKTIAAIISILLVCLCFTGCFNPCFNGIVNDVPPETATVNGAIRSITRYTVGSEEYLVVAANGGLLYKKTSDDGHGKWNTVSNLPFVAHHFDYYHHNEDSSTGAHIGQQILKTLADEKYLYLVTVEYEDSMVLGTTIPKQFYVWSIQVSDWESIEKTSWEEIGSGYERACTDGSENKDLFQFYEKKEYYKTRFNVFSTNSVKKNHRKVYIRSGSDKGIEYYEISNGSISKTDITATDATESNKEINGACYIGDSIKFFTSSAVCSNETAGANADMIYHGTKGDNYLYYYDGSKSVKTVSCGVEPSCIAVTKDSIIIGRADLDNYSVCTGGVVKTALKADKTPGDSLISFETNITSQLSNSYFINAVLAVDPSLEELENSIYASISFRGSTSTTSSAYSNVGLWSYYKDRGNWNRE